VKYLFRGNIKLLRLCLSLAVITVFLCIGLTVYRPTGVPVLMYHSISDVPGNPLCVRPDDFQRQMRYLSENAFHVINLAQLEQYLYHSHPLPRKPVLITFDDGNRDNVTIALPILRKYNFSAVEFIPGSFIGTEGITPEEIVTLDSAGWDIGNHTFSHRKIPNLSPEDQRDELQRTNKLLERILKGKKVRYFSYPVGKYNQTAINTLKSEGFALAFTTESGWVDQDTDPFMIPRVSVGPATNLELFKAKVNTPFYPHIPQRLKRQ
jgi:peptidoglycan/xylan/chitin deacetylase (PgdA/CDA1 family)